MKFFSFIMGAIFLVLSCLPCQDGAAAQTNEKDFLEYAHTKEQDHQHKDFCSPLCICSCCSTTTLHVSTVSIPIFEPEIQVNYNSFYLAAVKGISLPVWQPPQLIA